MTPPRIAAVLATLTFGALAVPAIARTVMVCGGSIVPAAVLALGLAFGFIIAGGPR